MSVAWPGANTHSHTSITQLHNLALAAYSGLCCGYTAWWLLAYEHTSKNKFMCARMDGSGAEIVFASFTLSKLWEWGDTVLLVWGGRSQVMQFLGPQFASELHAT